MKPRVCLRPAVVSRPGPWMDECRPHIQPSYPRVCLRPPAVSRPWPPKVPCNKSNHLTPKPKCAEMPHDSQKCQQLSIRPHHKNGVCRPGAGPERAAPAFPPGQQGCWLSAAHLLRQADTPLGQQSKHSQNLSWPAPHGSDGKPPNI